MLTDNHSQYDHRHFRQIDPPHYMADHGPPRRTLWRIEDSLWRKARRTRHVLWRRIGPVLVLVALVCLLEPNSAAVAGSSETGQRQANLTLQERVAYQRAIEEVYWRHRLWPKENPRPKPRLDDVMPPSTIRAKVEDYLRKSEALAVYWQRPITGEQLQAEMQRQARQTKRPDVLRELWQALGNDPYLVAECLARPALANRIIRNWYARDERYHGELKRQAEAEIKQYGTVQQTPRRPLWRMRRMSGNYNEVVWMKGENRPADVGARLASPNADSLTLDPEQWDEKMRQLAQTYYREPQQVFTPNYPLPVGELSGLREQEDRFYITAVLEKQEGRVKVASVEWKKEPFDRWWQRAQEHAIGPWAEPRYDYRLPDIGSWSGSCKDDTWTPTLAPMVRTRFFHTAVWTGSEMIVWGGSEFSQINTGGRYDPATDSWVATSTTNVPSARSFHTAVWTGSEMIVWGGLRWRITTNSGGRYDPATDRWVETSTTNAPNGRHSHTAVWTGREMIVWGGRTGIHPPRQLNTGGRYDLATDRWVETSTMNAPSARGSHTAVWTESEMIVWGGQFTNTGGRYDPATDRWVETSTMNAPSPRSSHKVVWTGSEMIVWGGYPLTNTGGRYDPATDRWVTTSTTNAPSPRIYHTAVWTGREMIVWGGGSGDLHFNTGGRYDPATDRWIATSTTNVPSARSEHTAVWTGSEMIIWGGYPLTNTGGRYDPATDGWVAMSTNTPSPRYNHTSVWTGREMIVWGGEYPPPTNTGGRYDPATDNWMEISILNAPSPRIGHTAVWTGREMIVWGGGSGDLHFNTGGHYDPATDSWIATSTTNAPSARSYHTAVWTGREMIVFGGRTGGSPFNTGGRYDPAMGRWVATSTTNYPSPRSSHTSVWTGSEMIVWGGWDGDRHLNTGDRYDPATDTWVEMSTTNAPHARENHKAVWTGSEMIVWGGRPDTNTGGRYDPATDTWVETSTTSAPSARFFHTAVWTGSEMIVWGGSNGVTRFNTGGRYDPVTDSWVETSTKNAPSARWDHTAVWTGAEMIVWGGAYGGDTGGRYCASAVK